MKLLKSRKDKYGAEARAKKLAKRKARKQKIAKVKTILQGIIIIGCFILSLYNMAWLLY